MICSKCGNKINAGYVTIDGKPVCADCAAAQTDNTSDGPNADMFDDIEKKLKITAKVIFWIGIAVSVVFGFIQIESGMHELNGTSYYIKGISIIAGGVLASWVLSLVIASLGKIIESSDNKSK